MHRLGLPCLLCAAACTANPWFGVITEPAVTEGADVSTAGDSQPTAGPDAASAPTDATNATSTASATQTANPTGEPTDTGLDTGPATGADTGEPDCDQLPNPELRFSSPGQFRVSPGPVAVAVGDVDGDGHGDIITANFAGSAVDVLLGDGSARFATHLSFPASIPPRVVAIGDVTGDQKPDIVTNGVLVFKNDGGGDFSESGPYGDQVEVDVTAIVLFDLDLASGLDVATASEVGAGVRVLKNNGLGALAPINPNMIQTLQASDLEAGRINGDDKPDLVVCGKGGIDGKNVQVLINDDMGSFLPPVNYYTVPNLYSCALADVDQDGHLDIVSAGAAGMDMVPPQLSFLRNINGSFDTVVEVMPYPQDPKYVATADFDGDGVLELITRGYYRIGVYEGDGSLFTFHEHNPTAFNTGPIAIGKVDGDDLPDVVTVHEETDAVEVLLSRSDWTVVPPDSAVGLADEASSVAVDNLDDDDDDDLVIGCESGRVYFTRSEPGGVFVPGDPQIAPVQDASVTVAELDGVVGLDVLVGGDGMLGPTVLYRNKGGFMFEYLGTDIPVGSRDFLVGDLDDDGDRDVVARWSAISINQNIGGGMFTGGGNIIDYDKPSIADALGDIDGDGILDIAHLVDPNAPEVHILLGMGAGGFMLNSTVVVGQAASALVIADLDKDGDGDLAIGDGAGIGVARNTAGTFLLQDSIQLPAGISELADADLSGDGYVDLVALSAADHSLHLLRNAGDGSLDHVARYLVTEDPRSPVIADVDGDCIPDLVVARYKSKAASVLFARP